MLRELGLVTIFWDGNFSGAQKLFAEDGEILDAATHVKLIDKFLGELLDEQGAAVRPRKRSNLRLR